MPKPSEEEIKIKEEDKLRRLLVLQITQEAAQSAALLECMGATSQLIT